MAKIDPNAVVTNKTLSGAVDAVLKGIDNMFDEQKKFFASKNDLKVLATKEDLKREAGWLKDDIKGLKADLSIVPGRGEFNNLKAKVDRFITS